MELFIFWLEIIGTISFAISGALTGLGKRMDIFGVCILGLTTATGGGMIRDLILGITPPAAFGNPIYVLISLAVSIIVFVIYVWNQKTDRLESRRGLFDFIMLLTDSAGLGVFTVCGVKAAIEAGFIGNKFLVIFVAVVTGVGGGVLRDIFAGDRPYIFVKHVYACASLVGAVICTLMWSFAGSSIGMTVGFALVLIIRICAARFRWSLPRPKSEK